jgi:hypothetical protein
MDTSVAGTTSGRRRQPQAQNPVLATLMATAESNSSFSGRFCSHFKAAPPLSDPRALYANHSGCGARLPPQPHQHVRPATRLERCVHSVCGPGPLPCLPFRPDDPPTDRQRQVSGVPSWSVAVKARHFARMAHSRPADIREDSCYPLSAGCVKTRRKATGGHLLPGMDGD